MSKPISCAVASHCDKSQKKRHQLTNTQKEIKTFMQHIQGILAYAMWFIYFHRFCLVMCSAIVIVKSFCPKISMFKFPRKKNLRKNQTTNSLTILQIIYRMNFYSSKISLLNWNLWATEKKTRTEKTASNAFVSCYWTGCVDKIRSRNSVKWHGH